MRCLEKDPAARPPTADDLARCLSETALERGWSQEHARAWWRANVPA